MGYENGRAAAALDAACGAPVPIGVSARHVHLSAEHVAALFGPGHALQPRKGLSQPGQFAAEEIVVVAGPRGALAQVRVLGPSRGVTQVELAGTDCIAIGIQAPVRDSGDVHGSPGAVLVGPKGSVALSEGVIIASRHLHLTPLDATVLGLSDGDLASVLAGTGRRCTVFDGVLCRVSGSYRLEFHIDTDEANAAACTNGDMGWIMDLRAAVGARAVPGVLPTHAPAGQAGMADTRAGMADARSGMADTRAGMADTRAGMADTRAAAAGATAGVAGAGETGGAGAPARTQAMDLTFRSLITEDDILTAWRAGCAVRIRRGAIITPLAQDAKRQRGVELITA
ncbi:MAG: phosphate propanoyltransferase [Clostridia bacterium]|nr:phosphate propanoyltransferase [Clostridia bacterium]